MVIHVLALGLLITHSNLSKMMKRIFGLLMVFCFALCMAAPTVNASVFDDDVGLTTYQGVSLTQGVVLTDLQEVATPAIAHLMIPQSECPLSDFQSKANECLNEKPPLNTYWHGGDSKASRCGNADIHNQNRTANTLKYNSTKYGKGNKRLTCKAKA